MTNLFMHLRDLFSEAWTQAATRFSAIVPEALLALFVVLIGWLIASLLQILVLRIFRFFAIDKLAGKTPLERILKDCGITRGVTDILGLLIFWLSILLTLTFAAEILKLSLITQALIFLTGFIPQIIAGLLIIVFGLLLARFLQVLAMQALKRADVVGERIIGKLVYILVLVFVVFAAVEQVGIHFDFIATNAIVIAAIVILIGIATIIASRSLIEGWVLTQYVRHHIHIGDLVEIDGTRGTVEQISSIAVVLRVDNERVIIPSKDCIEKGYKHFSASTHE